MMYLTGLALCVFANIIYSYIFVDPRLVLSASNLYRYMHSILSPYLYEERFVTGVVFCIFLILFFGWYVFFLRKTGLSVRKFNKNHIYAIIAIVFLMVLAYPAYSYDIFNYILTSKVAFHYHENPYVVMPVEISGEAALAYTRAANKVALYGPTWILLTWLPHTAGSAFGVWATILAFKLLVGVFYLLFIVIIWRTTGSYWNVIFFAANPLVINEVLVSGHNDIVMMVLAVMALTGFQKKSLGPAVSAWLLWFLSVFVKGATVVFAPLLFIRFSFVKILKLAYVLMGAVFALSPFREELYPWYAVWLVSLAALLPRGKAKFIHGFTVALCMGLELRHLPYILTREYGGSGPLIRTLCTVVPVLIFVTWYGYARFVKNQNQKTI